MENLIAHLGLLSGIAEGLQSGFEVYANNSDIVPHLVVCLKVCVFVHVCVCVFVCVNVLYPCVYTHKWNVCRHV